MIQRRLSLISPFPELREAKQKQQQSSSQRTDKEAEPAASPIEDDEPDDIEAVCDIKKFSRLLHYRHVPSSRVRGGP